MGMLTKIVSMKSSTAGLKSLSLRTVLVDYP